MKYMGHGEHNHLILLYLDAKFNEPLPDRVQGPTIEIQYAERIVTLLTGE